MVMPRSRSRSMPSRTWSDISRCVKAPVSSRMRSDRVVLPWSMWAMMQKFRMSRGSIVSARFLELEPGIGVDREVGDLAAQEQAPAHLGDHGGVVGGERRADGVALEPRLPGLLRDAGPQQRVAGHPARQSDRARSRIATFITRLTMNSTTADWNEARRSRVSRSGSPAGKGRSSPRARAWRSTAVLKPLNEKSRLPSLIFGGDSGTDVRSPVFASRSTTGPPG